MAVKPIIFSEPMVLALLAGRKTQTRRTSGLSDVNRAPSAWSLHNVGRLGYMAKPSAKGKFGATFESREVEPGVLLVCPQRLPYEPGDKLWVREAFALVPPTAYNRSPGVEWRWNPQDDHEAAVYRAGWDRCKPGRWRSSIHMPRWASRLTLTVTDVRVQRLRAITREDAIAEGLVRVPTSTLAAEMGCDWGFEGDRRHGSPVSAFAALWNSIHGSGAYEANPWVVALTFGAERRNVDAPP